jgi:tetratricopeptide (TPR) repeat protein
LGPTEVKGVAQPINIYEVIATGSLHGHFDLAVRRGLTKFVGRQSELKQIAHALELARGAHGQIIAVVAEAGTGKSRLSYEFKATLAADCKVLEAYSVSHGKASAWLPVLALLHNYFGIQEVDDPVIRREKLRAALTTLDPALSETQSYLFTLLAIPENPDPIAHMDAQVKRRRTLEALKRIVLRESLKQPIVVIFEDLHWVDDQTQALLDLLADGIGNARVLMLVNYRPEYRHEWGNKSYYSQLRLDALGRESAAEMLSTILGDGVELNPLKRLIIERTEGNPFFIEEMVQALFDEGTIVRNGAVKLARSLSQMRLPPTVQGILASRIDRLPPAHKELLGTLAVIGRVSSLALIRRVAKRPDGKLEPMLAALQAGEFIYEVPAAAGIEYTFKHTLTQEVAYNSLLIEKRKELHERTAQAIESAFADQLNDHLTGLAYHYSRTDNASKAVEYLVQVGQQAIQRSAHAEAISNLNSAISRVHGLPDSRDRAQRLVRLELTRARALAITGQTSEVEQAFLRAREVSEHLDFTEELSSALLGLCGQYLAHGKFPTVYELAGEVERRAESAEDQGPLTVAIGIMGVAEYEMGDFLQARNHLETAISHYDRRHDKPVGVRTVYSPEVATRYYAGAALWYLGYPEQAVRRSNEAVALAQELSNPLDLASAGFAAGHLHLLRGEALAAQEIAERTIMLCSEQGLTYWLARARRLRAWALIEQGSTEESIAQVQNDFGSPGTIWKKLVGRHDRVQLIEAWIRIARRNPGCGAVGEMLAVANGNENDYLAADIYRLKGELQAGEGDTGVSEAESCFRRSINIAQKQSAKSIELRATTSLARLWASFGRCDEARATLAEIYNWFTEGFDTVDLKEAKALLEELSV